MTQNELIAALSEETGESKAAVGRVLRALGDLVHQRTSVGSSVTLPRIGKVSSRWRKRSVLRDIQGGRKMMIDGRFVPYFRPSAQLRRVAQNRTAQHWRDPDHQKAWRLGETLIGDLDLYHGASAPSLSASMTDSAVRTACASAFGEEWRRALATYGQEVPAKVRDANDYLVRSAVDCWST